MDITWIRILTCLSVYLNGLVSLSERYFMEDECGEAIDMEKLDLASVRLELTKYQQYHSNMECVFRVIAPENKRLMVQIFNMELEYSEECTSDYLQIHDGQELIDDVLPDLPIRLCDSRHTSPTYASSGRHVTIRFHSNDKLADDGFRIHLAAFRTDPSGQCYSTEFQCERSGRCIHEELECDDHVDCEDASDECELSTAAIIGLSVGCVAFVIAIVGFIVCWCCYKRRNERINKLRRLNSDSSAPEDTNSAGSYIQYYRPASIKEAVYDVPVFPVEPTYVRQSQYSVQRFPAQIWVTAPPTTLHNQRDSHYIEHPQ